MPTGDNQTKRLTIEYVKEEIAKINPKAIILTSKYVNNRQPLDIVCSDCGEVFQKSWDTIKQKRTCKCRSCARKEGWRLERREENFEENLKQEFLEYGYIVLETPVNMKDKYLCKDKEGYLGKISLQNAKLGKHFGVFSPVFNEENILYNINQFFNNNHVGSKAIDYKICKPSCSSKVRCQCECGNIFYGNLGDITTQNKWRCEQCSQVKSSLEYKVEKVLTELNLDFVYQKRFSDCRSDTTNYPLPFDFYINKYNFCIEVDGEQHFKVSKFGNETEEEAVCNYHRTQHYDNIKTNFCKERNIALLRIDYKQFRRKGQYKETIENFIRPFLCSEQG
nr:MAG TPA: restriction enzyme [Caudoviricetes sp.]